MSTSSRNNIRGESNMQQKQADTRRSTDSKTDASSKTLLVTVGSTLFPSLTDIILSAPILEVIASSGTTKLAVQYGRADLPSASRFREGGGFEVDLDLTGKGASTFVTMGGPSESFNEDDRRRRELKVEVFRFTDDFEGLIRSSDYVISHAGSGSILTTLRTVNRTTGNPIPLLVVPNESLMDNHQAELADKMGEEGYLFVSRVEELSRTLPVFLDDHSPERRSVKPFPQLNKTAFRDILDETMGYI